MTTKEVQSWKAIDWQTKVRYVKPSGGGAVGVTFVWTKPATAVSSSSTADFVIKPMQGSASPTKFAEHVLKTMGNAVSPNSKPISARSVEGMALLNTLKTFRMQETDANAKARWTEVMPHYSSADVFLIQDLQTGIKEFSDEYRQNDGLRGLLVDQNLMQNLGKLFAADAFIGNGDRLFKPNTGNIVFKPDGTLSAIDSATVLTSFHAIVNEVDQYTRDTYSGTFDNNTAQWSENVVGKMGGLAVPTQAQQANLAAGKMPVLPPSFGMEVLFDVQQWWNKMFRTHLESALDKLNPPQSSPPEKVWSVAYLAFKAGVDQGLREVDAKLSGFDWMKLKSKYKGYVAKYGGDPNLDWTNFKVRRLYFKLRRKGKDHATAMAGVQQYAKGKLPG